MSATWLCVWASVEPECAQHCLVEASPGVAAQLSSCAVKLVRAGHSNLVFVWASFEHLLVELHSWSVTARKAAAIVNVQPALTAQNCCSHGR